MLVGGRIKRSGPKARASPRMPSLLSHRRSEFKSFRTPGKNLGEDTVQNAKQNDTVIDDTLQFDDPTLTDLTSNTATSGVANSNNSTASSTDLSGAALKHATRSAAGKSQKGERSVARTPHQGARPDETVKEIVQKSILDAIQQGDWDYEPLELPSQQFDSTGALPGSDEKLAILAARAQRGLPLWHDGDCRDYDDTVEA